MIKKEVENKVKELKGKVSLVLKNGRVLKTNSATLDFDGVRSTEWYGSSIPFDEIKTIYSYKAITGPNIRVSLGSDPELFVKKDNKVVPSKFVVPSGVREVTEDGFQIELNPSTDSCRQVSAAFIQSALNHADTAVQKIPGASLSLDVGVIIDDKTWKASDNDVKRFGCSPTSNAYEEKRKLPTGMRVKFRAGGGHIHLGLGGPGNFKPKSKEAERKLVKLMDIFAGNTMVLLDRDSANARRRKHYGRAGEYRTKTYGLEYRVLSNFWLRGYLLWSLATAQLRTAILVQHLNLEDEVLGLFKESDIKKAINENDFDLAMQNFNILKEWMEKREVIIPAGINLLNVDKFIKWASSKDPLSTLPIENFTGSFRSRSVGFERFIEQIK